MWQQLQAKKICAICEICVPQKKKILPLQLFHVFLQRRFNRRSRSDGTAGGPTGHIKDVELNVISAAYRISQILYLGSRIIATANVHEYVYTFVVYIDSVGFGIAYLLPKGNARAL